MHVAALHVACFMFYCSCNSRLTDEVFYEDVFDEIMRVDMCCGVPDVPEGSTERDL